MTQSAMTRAAMTRAATVIDTLSHLEPDALANVTLSAVATLVGQNDLSIARAALAAWGDKLAHQPAVLSALVRLSGSGGQTDRQFVAVQEPE